MPAPDVALVSLYPPPGSAHSGSSGVASYTANLARGLAGEGAAVTVIAQHEEGEPSIRTVEGVAIERRFHRGPGALTSAARAALGTGAPVVHLQHEVFLYGGLSSLAALPPTLRVWRARGVGPVVTMHQVVDPRTVNREFTAVHGVRAPSPLARVGIGGMQATIRRLAARTVVHEASFAEVVPGAIVMPHGIGVAAREAGTGGRDSIRRDARRRLGVTENGFVAMCFGFVAPYKGLEAALVAATLVGDGIELVVAGGEHPRLAGRGYLDGLRAQWGQTVRFTGYVPEPDVADWFGAADVIVLPYPRPFSSSGVLALAIQHETPVVLSARLAECIGAPAELGVPVDPPSLAARLDVLASSRAARDAAAASTRLLGADRTWPAIARRHLQLYREVTDGHRAAVG